MDQNQKDEIFNLIVKNKMSIFNSTEKEKRFQLFLLKNNINLKLKIKDAISFLKNIDKKCKIEDCNNERFFYGLRLSKRYEYGFGLFCSTSCYNKYKSIRQTGLNNTSHRMSSETKERVKKNNSDILKEKIKNGSFTPCITNSWSGSKCYLNINNKIITYRSTWEAFFHLCNTNLQYESIVIEYVYKEKKHNYIVDFVDIDNKKIYEIKPDRCRKIERVVCKELSALKWCEENGYDFIFIGDEWFKNNFNKEKYLLDNQDQKENIIKKLKQFSEN